MRSSVGRRPDVILAATVLVTGVLAALLATGFSVGGAVDATVHPVAMAVLLGALSIPIIRWAVEGDRTLILVALGGLATKAFGTYLRFSLTGSGDNRAYHRAGSQIAVWLGESIVGPDALPPQFGGDGSNRLAYAVGWLYYFTGPSRLTGFVVFSFIGFMGVLFFYRAAITAVPEVDRVRLALLMFFMPSMVFWPSTIGKEAWMIFFLGLATLGVATLVDHRLTLRHLAALTVGLIMAGQVRPHMAALLLVAMVAAAAWPSRTSTSRLRQVAIVVVALTLLTFAMSAVADFFGAESGEVNDILDFAQERTDEGVSSFEPLRVTGPLNFLPGAVSVMFRPFPFETDNLMQLLGAIESTLFFGLLIASFTRLRRVPELFLRNGYIRYAVFYTVGFVIAFSVISNFGILARQRSQLWPVFLVLLAIEPRRRADAVSEPEAQASLEYES